jgi:S-adenosylmethionine:tRNA ribosyltransferase-isomerase
VRTNRVEEHRLSAERYFLPESVVLSVEETRKRGGRVIAVGTTVTRVLESQVDPETNRLKSGEGACSLFIVPGHHFRVVDALVTNFHLPGSTLLMLVSAFAGRETVLSAYGEAVEAGYHFYSYGDAMFIN